MNKIKFLETNRVRIEAIHHVLSIMLGCTESAFDVMRDNLDTIRTNTGDTSKLAFALIKK